MPKVDLLNPKKVEHVPTKPEVKYNPRIDTETRYDPENPDKYRHWRLTEMMFDEAHIKEFVNYIVFDGLTKKAAFHETFREFIDDEGMTDSLTVKAYNWVKTERVQRWMEKANKSLEIDWLDKRVTALNDLFEIGINAESNKEKISAYDTFLKHLGKEEKNMINIMGDGKVNIIQVVQDKLESLTSTSIQPDLIEAEIDDKQD